MASRYPFQPIDEVMTKKAHGTTKTPPQDNLRYGVDEKKADEICCFTRNRAETSGYFLKTDWLKKVNQTEPTTYYDSVSGLPVFKAPVGRSFKEFLDESKTHGWLSFRDSEVNWEEVRCLKNGECVSLGGTHLGNNIPDAKGNRYCINLVSIAGNPTEEKEGLVIGYWAIRGLGAPLRMTCEYAGASYKPILHRVVIDSSGKQNKCLWFENFKPSLKAKNPFANLPYILDGDTAVCQTNACFKYLGKKFNLMGKDEAERSKCEQSLCQAMDMRNDMVGVFYGSYPKNKDKLVSMLGNHYNKFENWLSHHDTQYLSSNDSLCVADFHLWELLDQMEKYVKEHNQPSPIKGKERLTKYYATVRAEKKLQNYFNSDLYKLPCNNPSAYWR